MSYFAKLENGIVKQVIVADKSFIDTLDGTWIETLEINDLSGKYAGIGYIYDDQKNAFYAPSPYESWKLNEKTWSWEPPINHPNDEKQYIWDEIKKTWEEIANGL